MATVVDLFNPTVSTEDKAKDTEVYSVSHKKAKNGNVYKSVIRFIPWFKDPSNNYTDKYVTYLINPTNPTSGRYIDNPQENSPLTNMYFRLVNTKIPKFEEFAKKTIKSKRQYAALVQIISDENQPNLVGQIKVFKFGKTIMEKIKGELNPAMGTPINPFHPIQGRYFSLVVTEQSGFPNYDQSQFFSVQEGGYVKPSGMWYLNPTTNALEAVTEQTNQQYVMDYLQQYSPDLSKYDIQPWSEQDQKYVSDVLSICENYIATGGNLADTSQVVTQQSFATLSNSPVQNPVFPGAVNNTPTFPGSVPTPTPTPTPQFAPGAPTPVPASFPAGAPEPAPTPQFGIPTPQPMVQGVEIPTVAPKGAPTGTAAPSMGMNVDDILGQL
jgi:hypothetical protein